MSLENILDKIREDGRMAAEEILSAAGKERDRILDDGRKKAERENAALSKKLAAKAELEERRITALAALESRKIVLQSKQEIMDECFRLALQQLSSMDAADYETFLKHLILKNVKDDAAVYVLQLSKHDLSRVSAEKLLPDINRDLEKTGEGASVVLSKNPGELLPGGGFVISHEGSSIKNFSWETLLRLKRPDWELEISKMLFG